MRFSAAFVALVAPMFVSALPMRRTASAGDITVLKFAHVLEQLETQFYTQALQKFQPADFIAAGFSDPTVPIQQFSAIQSDESTHTSVLEQLLSALGEQPITGCQFNFDQVLTSVSAMAPVARIVEDLGVAAYLGAAHLMSDPVLLTDAASILTVEARHQTILNLLNGGTAIPQAFDLVFSPTQVLAVASPFISGCTIDVGAPANPTLTVTNTAPVAPGVLLTFSSPAITSNANLSCQMMLGGAPAAIVFPIDQCIVPEGINGPVALFITNDTQPLSSNIAVQATNTLVAGPTMAFVDTIQDNLATLSRTGTSGSASSGSSDSGASASSSNSTAPVSSSAVSVDSSAATATAASAPVDSSAATATAASAPVDSSAATATAASASVDSSAASPTAAASSVDSSAASATTAAVQSFSTALITITPDQASAIVASAAAEASSAPASAASSAAAAAPSAANNAASGSTSNVQTLGGPNLYTGPVSNGTLTVLGWTTIPAPQ